MTPTVSRRSERSQQTRNRLIDAALSLSAERGFAALSLREVARKAQVAPNSFYRHFRDMDELGLHLVDQVGLSLRQLMRRSRQSRKQEGSSSMVRASILAFMEFVRGNPNHFRLLLGERSGSSPAFRKALHAEIDRFVGELTEDLSAGYRAVKRPSDQAGLVAEAIVAVVFTVGAEAMDLPAHKTTQLANRLIREVQIILRGAGLYKRRPQRRPSPIAADEASLR